MKRTVHTVVEIFDSIQLQNNIIATQAFHAKRTIFLYEYNQVERMEGVMTFLKTKLPDLVIEKVLVESKNAKRKLQELFQHLKNTGEDVLVEVNGGSPIFSNYARECSAESGFPCVVLDASENMVIGVEHASEWEGYFEKPYLEFRDILMLHGRIYNRNMHMLAEEKYYDCILAMSEYAFDNESDFSFFYDFVHHRSDGILSEDGLQIVLNKEKGVSERILAVFDCFQKQGFITDLKNDKEQIAFTCVAPFVKEMLAVKGSWLEMYIYIMAKRSGLFSEVYQSVMIGWDIEKKTKFNVENEIDVVLMKEGTPIFVSCKMTNPKPDSLNEIYAMADGFGGVGAIPVLATSFHVKKRNQTFWNRAKEMGVGLIDYSILNKEDLMEFFKNL